MAHILIVDDEDVLRDLLSQILESMGHTCDQAANGMEGTERVAHTEYDLILTDIRMPGISGIEFLRKIQPRVDARTPCMIITALADEPSVAVKAVRLACDFLSKPFELGVVQDAVRRALRMREAWVFRRNYSEELEQALQQMEAELRETHDGVLIGFAAMLEGKDWAQDESDAATKEEQGTRLHCVRVRDLSTRLARKMGIEDEDEIRDLQLGAMLHDVGKYRVPDAILWKKGPLTPDEWVTMRMHPEYGAAFVQEIPFLAGAAELILCHHERWDGGGYPRKLAETDVPLSARIFAVVDAFDAMTTARCYRDAQSAELALEELRRHAGTQFDPEVVETFAQHFDEIAKRQSELQNGTPSMNGRPAALVTPALQDVARRIRKRVAEQTRLTLSS